MKYVSLARKFSGLRSIAEIAKNAQIMHIWQDFSEYPEGLLEAAAIVVANLFHKCEINIAFHENY